MAPLDFPNSPTLNQLYEPAGAPKYKWDGQAWTKVPAEGGGGGTADALPLAGGTMTGPIVLAADPVADLEAATARYVDNATGMVGLLGYFDYTFNGSAYVAPPIAGNFRMNNANQTLATHLFIHEQTAPANDAALMLAQIAVGDKLLCQKKSDATKWRRYTVTAISDAGTYWDFTVTYVDGGAALDNARTAITVQKTSAGGGVSEAPTDGALYYRRGSTNAWVKATVSSSAPSGGVDGDIWYQVP